MGAGPILATQMLGNGGTFLSLRRECTQTILP